MDFSNKDLHLWRLVVAVSWSILVQFLLLSLYITAMNIDVWSLSVFTVPFSSVMSVKTLYIIPLAGMIFLHGIVFNRDYVKPSKAQFINRRFLVLFSLFSYQNLIALCMYTTLGFVLFNVYASLSKEHISSISMKCSFKEFSFLNDVCLNEKKLFLILAGIWTGLYSFIKDYILNTKTLMFPPIQQRKFIRVKSAFFPCLKKAMINSLSPSVLFCVLYYFKGNAPRSYICSLTGFRLSEELLDTFLVFLDIELMVYLWIFTTVYLLTLDVMTILSNIHLTERAYFPVTSFMLSSTTDNIRLLQDALSAEKIPIIQHLGFLDLALLSQFDCQRRTELFTLSQPGGHPHSWNAIVNECFKVIDKFTNELDKCIDVSRSQIEKKSEQSVPKTPNTSASYSCHQRSYNMRNLSLKPTEEYIEQSPTVSLRMSYERLVKVYHEWVNKKFDAFCKKPLITYFFGEMNEPKIKYLLFHSQPVVWAVESLSLLVCHSIQEDRFGVAQKDLPKIIVSLLDLKNSLDKLQKRSILIKKSNKLDLVDIQMKSALKFGVKQSIYRIAIAYKDYINDINISPAGYVVQMMNFVEFKEV